MSVGTVSGGSESRLDKPLTAALQWLTWERAVYIALALVALGLRLWGLGARAMSHDESLHTMYSWKLFVGQGYVHDPMMHGPFKFHANALVYFLLGDTDFTSRLLPALFGTVLVVLPYFLRRWLGRIGGLVAAVMLTVSPNFLYYSRYIRDEIYIAVFSVMMLIALFGLMRDRRAKWVFLGGVTLMVSIASMEATYIIGFIVLTFILAALVWERVSEEQAQWIRPALLVLAALGLLTAALVGRSAAPTVGGRSAEASELTPYILLFSCFVVAIALAWYAYRGGGVGTAVSKAIKSVTRRTILITLGAMLVIWALLFTTFFTNSQGLITGSFGQISYWLGQHTVHRGDQPWYYYFVLMPLYEFLPFLGAIAATIYYAIRGARRGSERDSLPIVPLLVFWTIMSTALFSWAGEKMPWLVLYPVMPMVLLSGRFVHDLLDDVDWRAVWTRGGAVVAVLLPVAAYTLVTLVRVSAFRGMSLQKLNSTMMWLAALGVAVLLGLALVRYGFRIGGRATWKVAVATAFVCLLALTVRFSWMANFVNYDNAKELMVYAHGTQDVKLTMNEISEISKRTVGDNQIRVAYDSDSTWPLEWYLREFPNKVFYGDTPSREAMDAPIVIAGSPTEGKVKPFLGSKYYRFERRLVWWPIEDYKGLTLSRIVRGLKDPVKRQEIWDIVWFRKYKYAMSSWPMIHNFAIYIRKDVAAQMWQYGVGPSGPAEPLVDPFEQKRIQVSAVASIGQPGADAGQLREPRVVAVDAQGFVYVGDSGNRRVQVFGLNGQVVRQWGKEGNGPGDFTEIWGIAVDADGNVYVSDTWNHRVEKFDSAGTFVSQIGAFGDSGGKVDILPGQFYGPRAVAVDLEGNILVADTGNKRVQKFSSDGKFLGAYGGEGVLDGQFEEPVGLAVDSQGFVYVADTWNHRIQKFDSQMQFVAKWDVPTWEGESVMNKPYLAIDSRGRLYASDPESFRVLQYSASGELLAVFGEFGQGPANLNLPLGLAVDPNNGLYVVDAANNRVQVIAPVGR